ncbi:AMP-binding protein [Roseospira marina]|uniref:AMP-binding protein n=1 Tax=Roseospira marina TaxID=140057 RepID=UPI001478A067|nr:AMP-binding protein [Roseospira marina]MBB4314663.1 acyl-coenzyme A synthetase/AMP-(fatty) acid ligase [Roseospira marina]MBB5087652.1 acyl-coenzyme A synthetase/AMP-(fatty) acid ligase [Roseospira marina]
MTHPLVTVRDPDAVAVITEDGRAVRYADLVGDIDRVAATLPPRAVLLILGRNDYTTLVHYLAALQSGTVPLILAADTQPDHVRRLVAAFSPPLVLAEPTAAAALEALEPLGAADRYTLYRNTASTAPDTHPDLGYLATTSGSTGSPKLVRLTRANLIANAASIVEYLEIGPEDRAAASLPIGYSYGLSVINSHLMAGASIVLSDRSLMEQAFWQQMRAAGITSFAGVPYHYEMLLRLRLERLKLPTLTKMTQAGGRLAPPLIETVHAACQGLGIRFWTMYGQTEAAPRISYLPDADTLRKLGSIGRAIPGGRLWIRDDDGADITATGQVGELIYEGPNVGLGYARCAADLSRGDDNRGVLRTGDLARCDDDGYLFLEGRRSRFLKIYGNRISLDQVERWLAEQGLEGAAQGRDDHLSVVVVHTPGQDAEALRRDLAVCAGINAAAVAVHTIAALPRLPTGKVDYPCLSRMIPSP